jgi:hypothetical protein
MATTNTSGWCLDLDRLGRDQRDCPVDVELKKGVTAALCWPSTTNPMQSPEA